MAPLFHMEALLPGSISPKMSSILQSHVYPRVGRVFRALARFKSLLLDALGKTTSTKRGALWSTTSCSSSRGATKRVISYRRSRWTKRRGNNKVSSFVMAEPHYTSSWAGGSSSSSAALPKEELVDASYADDVCSCRESAWNDVVVPALPAGADVVGAGEEYYCGYLRWLEEETPDEVLVVEEEEEDEEDDVDDDGGNELNEIDRLAEKFIARCHAKFLLEKQESYRRYQEMMARSV